MTLLLLLACSAPSPDASTEPSSAAKTEDAVPQGALLWFSEADGKPLTLLGDVDANDAKPVIELEGSVFPGPPDPRGTHALLIHSMGEGEAHLESLILVPLSGGKPVQLGPTASAVRNPSWSADGSRIFYESSALSFRDLYSVDREGRVPKRLTEAEHGSFDPDWNAKGIVYSSSSSGSADIYLMNHDGTENRQLTTTTASDTHPRWSPDGRSITWLGRRGADVSVWRMDSKGQHQAPFRLKPRMQEIDRALSWSPDGSKLAVTVQTGPKSVVIDILDPQGRLVRRIQPKGVSEHPSWSPDAKWLIFNTSTPEAAPELYRLDATTPKSTPERLTTNTHPDWLARWISPR